MNSYGFTNSNILTGESSKQKRSSVASSRNDDTEDKARSHRDKVGVDVARPVSQTLVARMCDLLMDDTKKIVYMRRTKGIAKNNDNLVYLRPEGATFLDEVKNHIKMPEYGAKISENMDTEYQAVRIESVMVEQLCEYVTELASLYR